MEKESELLTSLESYAKYARKIVDNTDKAAFVLIAVDNEAERFAVTRYGAPMVTAHALTNAFLRDNELKLLTQNVINLLNTIGYERPAD